MRTCWPNTQTLWKYWSENHGAFKLTPKKYRISKKNKTNKNNRARNVTGREQPTPILRMGPVLRQAQSLDVVIRTSGQLSSSGGGVITSSLTNNPSGAAEFSALTSLFDSYRVEEMTFEFIPQLTYNSGFSFPPMGVIFDPDTTGAVASFSAAMQYDSFRVMDLSKHWSYSIKPPRISSAAALTGSYTVYENGFIDCGTPAAISSISWYAANATSSTSYGYYVCHYRVTFASRK